MTLGSPRFRPLLALEALARHHVDYVLIGGLAATLHGSPLTTGDADICPDPTPDNLVRLVAALRGLAAPAFELDDIGVMVASLADVIRSKEAAGRERDRAALPTLRLLLERAEKQ